MINWLAVLVKVPDPRVDHRPPVAFVTLPLIDTLPSAQIILLGPAFAIGALLIVNLITSLADLHDPKPAAVVSLSVTVPTVVSEADRV